MIPTQLEFLFLSFFLLPFALCGGCHLVSAVWDRVIKVTHNARQRRRGDSLVLWYCGQGILVVDRGTRKIWGKCGREETMEPTRVTDSSIGLTVSLFGVKSHGIGCAHVRAIHGEFCCNVRSRVPARENFVHPVHPNGVLWWKPNDSCRDCSLFQSSSLPD